MTVKRAEFISHPITLKSNPNVWLQHNALEKWSELRQPSASTEKALPLLREDIRFSGLLMLDDRVLHFVICAWRDIIFIYSRKYGLSTFGNENKSHYIRRLVKYIAFLTGAQRPLWRITRQKRRRPSAKN